MSIQQPLVSVIVPTYKRSTMLPRAIDSILSQTYDNVQVVVVDDNNPDSEWRKTTSALIMQYKDNPKVKYVCHPANLNGSVARNTGIKESDGEIITYLDDDDMYVPEKIRKQVEFLLAHQEFNAVYCGWFRDGNKIVPVGEGDLSFGILSGSNIIITNAIMMWRDIALSCGGWDTELTRHQEAAYLLNFFRAGGMIGRLDEELVKFDTSDRSNVSNPELNEEQLLYLLEKNRDLIERCETNRKGTLKEIYARRYLGVVLPYAQSKMYFKAFLKTFQYGAKYPFTFMKVLGNYIKWRTSPEYIVQTR